MTAHRNFESTTAIAGSGILADEGCLIEVSQASGLGENERRGDKMLKLALFFFIVSIIAGVFGFTGMSVGAAGIAKVLFFICPKPDSPLSNNPHRLRSRFRLLR